MWEERKQTITANLTYETICIGQVCLIFFLQTLTRDTRLNHNSLNRHLDEYELSGCVDMGSQLQPISLLQRALLNQGENKKIEAQVLVVEWKSLLCISHGPDI